MLLIAFNWISVAFFHIPYVILCCPSQLLHLAYTVYFLQILHICAFHLCSYVSISMTFETLKWKRDVGTGKLKNPIFILSGSLAPLNSKMIDVIQTLSPSTILKNHVTLLTSMSLPVCLFLPCPLGFLVTLFSPLISLCHVLFSDVFNVKYFVFWSSVFTVIKFSSLKYFCKTWAIFSIPSCLVSITLLQA